MYRGTRRQRFRCRAPAVVPRKLARIELNNQLLADVGIDLLASRHCQHSPTCCLWVEGQPLRDCLLRHARDDDLEVLRVPTALANGDRVAHLYLGGGNVGLPATQAKMPMTNELPRLCPRRCPAH